MFPHFKYIPKETQPPYGKWDIRDAAYDQMKPANCIFGEISKSF